MPSADRQASRALGPKVAGEQERCSALLTAAQSSGRPCRDTQKMPRSPAAVFDSPKTKGSEVRGQVGCTGHDLDRSSQAEPASSLSLLDACGQNRRAQADYQQAPHAQGS